MTKNEIDFGVTLNLLAEFGITNAPRFIAYPGLVIVYQRYSDYNTEYIMLGDEQTEPITGSTQVKSTSRIALEKIMMSIGRPAAGAFFDLGKFDLQVKVACKAGMLSKMRDTIIIAKASSIISVCTDNLTDLASVSITLPKIAALTAAKNTFVKNNPIPITEIKGRADAGKSIKTLQKEIRSFTKKSAIEQMYVFELIDNAFLLSFLHITEQIHSGGRRRILADQKTTRIIQLFSATTNQKVVGAIVQVFELPKSYLSNKNGMVTNLICPIDTCIIQVQAFGFDNYSEPHIIDALNTSIITILLTPTVQIQV